MNRRSFVLGCGAAAVGVARGRFDVAAFDRTRVVAAADRFLTQAPLTVTAAHSSRSAGGPHDFFSEGDYWWPDPKNPDSPYIQRDGMSNPGNFVEHRKALMQLSVQMPALAAAWKISQKSVYAGHAAAHLRAWFVDEKTRMNPNLQYAQAIHGRFTGRGTGIIDTIHLVEVAQAIPFIVDAAALSKADAAAVKQWFADYAAWMTTHPNGIQERDSKNNHAACWAMQVAAFAKLTANRELLEDTSNRYKTILLPDQEAADGSFPRELARTKPYGYSLFNLEAMSAICQIHGLWGFHLPDGRGIDRAVGFLFPYIKDKGSWPRPPDVMYFDQWPMRQSALLFGGLALDRPEYIELWKKLPADSGVDEVVRNFFIRQPVLWV